MNKVTMVVNPDGEPITPVRPYFSADVLKPEPWTINPVGHCGANHQGEHLVMFYDEKLQLFQSVGKFLGTSLGVGGSALAITTEENRADIEKQLNAFGINVDYAKARNKLVILDARTTLDGFMREGRPVQELFEEIVGRRLSELSSVGFKLHAFGEMVALLMEDRNPEAALELESLWNIIAQKFEFSLLCAYPTRLFLNEEMAASFDKICQQHSRVLVS